ncbi:MAG: aspartate-semialdehyde dehydrogenase [Rickettsiales bacterium]
MFNIAVVGATGNVGREMLKILASRKFPVNRVFAIASKKSEGKKISFGDETLQVEVLDDFDFSQADIALFSPGAMVSSKYAPIAAKHCVVIDNTSFFRMHEDVPLIVPEVNGKSLVDYKQRNIIANPNCAVAQLVVALKPLHDFATIKRIVVTTFQSVSGAGKDAMDELYDQTKGKYMNQSREPKAFKRQIAFNIIPQIGDFESNGYTSEEIKIMEEIKKILGQEIEVTATAVRVPVFLGHSESINVEFAKPITAAKAREILKKAPGVEVMDNTKLETFATPIDVAGEDEVFVSRLREDNSVKNALNLWVVSDNLRKGAALNAVQIAEELISNYL